VPDPDVLGGAVFYLMDLINGVIRTVDLTRAHVASPAVRHEMGLNAARAAAALGEVATLPPGSATSAGPRGSSPPGRALARRAPLLLRLSWLSGPELPGVRAVADWLEHHRPPGGRPGLMHGDYHLANLVYAPDGPWIAAIVDWEMVTVGDPLLDLGWLLATWPDPRWRASGRRQ